MKVMASRRQLEGFWLHRLQEARQRYEAVIGQCAKAPVDGQLESDARAEYTRVLRIFTDLTLYGKVTDAPSAATSNGDSSGLEVTVISIVDDDESIRESTKSLLRSAGYQVATFASAERFLGSGNLAETECLILDVRMPGMDGLELQRRLNAGKARIPIIFISAHDDATRRRQATAAGAVFFLCKPFDASALIAAVKASLDAGQGRTASQPKS